ncbi:Embryogenesis-associated protein EMB8 [Zea mays]|uniref:Embryogenesis-associated protein EMB8 n=1 Tax=Zea mays TaxID=4577 RepID=A0A1D6N642_MAIZE|nr:Embryogenesis-associated protein EMB8 [Zea mays]
MVPAERYALAAIIVVSVFLYRFLELHVIGDILRGFRGGRVELTFHPASEIYHRVASKCRLLHGRYLATPWLASPHLQTLFLGIYGTPPSFTYKRQLYTVRDGGTIALDWLFASDLEVADGFISKDASTPLVVVVPGLTSDSAVCKTLGLLHGKQRMECCCKQPQRSWWCVHYFRLLLQWWLDRRCPRGHYTPASQISENHTVLHWYKHRCQYCGQVSWRRRREYSYSGCSIYLFSMGSVDR